MKSILVGRSRGDLRSLFTLWLHGAGPHIMSQPRPDASVKFISPFLYSLLCLTYDIEKTGLFLSKH
jgi:hypothetical protein